MTPDEIATYARERFDRLVNARPGIGALWRATQAALTGVYALAVRLDDLEVRLGDMTREGVEP